MVDVQPLTIRELWCRTQEAALAVPDWDDVESPEYHRFSLLSAAHTAAVHAAVSPLRDFVVRAFDAELKKYAKE